MVRGTTPTVSFEFSLVNPNDIAVAYLTISQREKTVIEKDISTAVVGTKTLSWDLSQTDTLKLEKGTAEIECRYRTTDNKAYKTKTIEEKVEDIQKGGEI